MPNGAPRAPIPESRLSLVTLGGVALRVQDARGDQSGESARTIFELGKPVALVTYVACAPNRTVAREHLLDLLWGDVEPDAAKHALRQTLWYLKKRLGDHPLIAGGDMLSITGGLECDRDALLAAAERSDMDEVVRLYTGDFFPGFAAPGGAEFERWADVERQRLRSLFCRSAEVVCRRLMSASRARDAYALARRVRDVDRMREAGWRLLFETAIARGDVVAAAGEADAFERLFAGEGVEPEPATRALLRTLRHTPTRDDREERGASQTLVAELVGREQEFARILEGWESARGGLASHVHVVATAGLGKTRLLSDAHARLRATRARTAFVRASLGAREIPFGLAGDLAHALARLPGASGVSTGSARALVALNPAISSHFPAAALTQRDDPDDALRRRTLALRELVMVVAEEQPVALFVDDLQWADPASRQLLAGLAGGLDRTRVLMVTASRPAPDAIQPAEPGRTIQLAPLPVSAVGALVASLAALPAEPWAEQVAAELWHSTSGTPLLVLETLQLAMERGLLERVDGEWNAPTPHALFLALQSGGALRHRVEGLERTDRWLLTLLAVVGAPLAEEVIVAASARPAPDAVASLGSLEQRGLAVRHAGLWSVSHDEIATMVVELADDDALRAAARGAGQALADAHAADPRQLRRAGMLLAQAGDEGAVARAFNGFAGLLRRAGDRRPNATLARDFVSSGTPRQIDRLVRSLPVSHRLGLYSAQRQVTAAAALIVLPVAIAMLRSSGVAAAPPPPEAVLVAASVSDDSVASLYTVPVRGAELTPGMVLDVDARRRRPDWRFPVDLSYDDFTPAPDGTTWIVTRVFPDSGGIDLVQSGGAGRERRLTDARGDDQAVSWSPDRRWIAFTSGRWDPRSRYDIAVRDNRTGNVRQLTRTPDSDRGPSWSSDGSRIAFVRTYWDGRNSEVCVVDVDGASTGCFGVPGADLSRVDAWSDFEHLLVNVTRGPQRLLARLDVTTGALDTIVPVSADARVSTDGRWVACRCPRPGFGRNAYLIFPIEAPNRAVEVDVSSLPAGRQSLRWATPPGRARHAERIAILSGIGAPTVGSAHLLSAVGLAPNGDTVDVGSIRWRSLDTTVAEIDSGGMLLAKRAGAVTIEASAGGWRVGRQELVIIPAGLDTLLLREDWKRAIVAPWVLFGDPRPRIDTASDGTPAFLNDGEGSFSSGVYTERAFPTARGLALDTWVSAAVTRDQWQEVNIEIGTDIDSVAAHRWDKRSGAVPRRFPETAATCNFVYPGGREGARYSDSLRFVSGGAVERALAPPTFRHGIWFKVRVQLFPDGRCGFAANGVPLWVSPAAALSDSVARVVVAGNSAGTKMLIGPVELREGIAPDIDWRRASLSARIPEQYGRP